MNVLLTPHEARIIGCLIEKSISTPEQYPLSLNALVNACNQKSNREPLLNLNEAAVQQVVDDLVKKRLIMAKSGFGSRVLKHQHRFCNTDFSPLQLSAQSLAILCELLLRGPQTPGELRTRAARLCAFDDLQQVETALQSMIERPEGPLLVKLPRESGRREARFAHLFCGEVVIPEGSSADDSSGSAAGTQRERIEQLEQQVEALQQDMAQIKSALGI